MNWPTPENIIKPSTDTEWPKWVTPHESHVVRKKVDGAPDHVSAVDFDQIHVNRVTGEVTVLVADEADEQRATSELVAETPAEETTDEIPAADPASDLDGYTVVDGPGIPSDTGGES